jgi:hypothetical protein
MTIHHQLERLFNGHSIRARPLGLPDSPDLHILVPSHPFRLNPQSPLGKFARSSKVGPGQRVLRIITLHPSLISLLLTALALPLTVTSRNAENYLAAIAKINLAHAKRPGTTPESELGKAIPRSAVFGLALLLKAKSTLAVSQALVPCGEAALDLDHFQRIRKRLLEIDQDVAGRLGDATVRERFLVREIILI